MNERKFDLWMREAKTDFKAGEILLQSSIFNVAIFNFVQAAEKAVKALLFLLDLQAWGHSISSFISIYESKGHVVDDYLLEHARELERHYIMSRYPDALPDAAPSDAYLEEDAVELRDMSRGILEFVELEKEKNMSE